MRASGPPRQYNFSAARHPAGDAAFGKARLKARLSGLRAGVDARLADMLGSDMDWRDFFNSDHPIYVNARHRLLHDQIIAKAISAYIPFDQARALDYGCGEASSADAIAARCEKLYLYDSAPLVLFKLRQRLSENPKIVILDDTQFQAFPRESLDMIVVVSVLQYIGEAEFERWLENFYARLKPGGRLVLGDVAPKNLSPFDDARALLEFGARGGFFFAAIGGLARTVFSSYPELRAKIGLTTYDEPEMLELLAMHGFEGARMATNIGHNQKRMTFVAHKVVT